MEIKIEIDKRNNQSKGLRLRGLTLTTLIAQTLSVHIATQVAPVAHFSEGEVEVSTVHTHPVAHSLR